MKKLERYIYIALIIILVSIVCTGATYIVMNEKNNNKTEIKENINQEKDKEKAPEIDLANSIKFKEIKTINDKIVEYFDVVLNNKKSILNIISNNYI